MQTIIKHNSNAKCRSVGMISDNSVTNTMQLAKSMGKERSIGKSWRHSSTDAAKIVVSVAGPSDGC